MGYYHTHRIQNKKYNIFHAMNIIDYHLLYNKMLWLYAFFVLIFGDWKYLSVYIYSKKCRKQNTRNELNDCACLGTINIYWLAFWFVIMFCCVYRKNFLEFRNAKHLLYSSKYIHILNAKGSLFLQYFITYTII